jgi:hypothetical protein
MMNQNQKNISFIVNLNWCVICWIFLNALFAVGRYYHYGFSSNLSQNIKVNANSYQVHLRNRLLRPYLKRKINVVFTFYND